ncbi:MAG: hypothetical protein UW30_C0017G0020 [Candidatus Giovannonibacteria bacterium GW2011_GWA2_44_13b]|uniref:Uncharacterized protein n=1 Tax=Candidatus Giovannonibacteria bacterium GW2011_GWA2_44_13b TaxID=1618647 RepID=A0A0G1H1U3_9BACT|nr:MAG: hypothetical protein UW30_C0017G0020 [Candidatus Giovannonibacteria bacterium GW2011_GWA2_44_13b]
MPNIVLTNKQLKRLAEMQKMGGMIAAERLRKKRLALTKQLFSQGAKEIRRLSPREAFLIGIALYWAEGYRKGNDEFGFTNSDPKMIKFIVNWLQNSCAVSADRIRLRICINNVHKNRLKLIQKFWFDITKMPANQFSRPTLINIKNKKAYKNHNEYFGTLRIKISKGTNFRRKLLGWIEGIAKNSPPG